VINVKIIYQLEEAYDQ